MRRAIKTRKQRGDRSLGAAASLESAESSRGTLLAAAIIVAAGIVVYLNSFTVPLLFEDADSIVENSTIKHLWPLWPMLSPPSAAGPVAGRPVVNISLAVNYAISGLAPWSYHAVNLLIHVLAALVLMGTIRRTLTLPGTPARLARAATVLATSIALVWVVHPLLSESVTYISQRSEPLVALFYLLTLYCSIRSATSERSTLWSVAAVIACALGMASNIIMVSAPLIVLLYDRAFLSGTLASALRNRWELYVGLATSWLLLAAVLLSSGGHGGLDGAVSCWAYLGAQCGAIMHYLTLCVWPDPLVFDYGAAAAQDLLKLVPDAIAVAVLGLAAVLVLWRRPKAGFLGAWFFAILLPTSSVIPVAGQAIAEHRMYLPLAAVVTAIVVGGFVIGQRLAWRGTFSPTTLRVMGGFLMVAAVLTLGILTFRRNWDYRSAISIWQDTVAKAPLNTRAYNCLGSALADEGRIDDAIALYRQALKIDPKSVEAYNNLGIALSDRGNLGEAIACYRRALQLNAANANILNNLGIALIDSGEPAEGIAQFEKALEANRECAEAYTNLGLALARRGRAGEAVAHFQMAIAIKPDSLDAGNALALLRATYPDEAVRNGAEAIDWAQRVVQLSGGKDPLYLDTLAAAYAESGRFDDAVQTAKNALELATQQNRQKLANMLRARIRLYEVRIPLREMPSSLPQRIAPRKDQADSK
jgi:protein O-mannosyl-transferase